jgi:hypothetical protein
MNSKRLHAFVLVVIAFVVLPASAAILSDNFDDDSGTLTGETATTGQTWADIPTRTSLAVGTQYGQSGNGVGNDDDAAGWRANEIDLGEIVNDGTIVISVDLRKQHRTSPVNEMNFALVSSSQSKETAVVWSADWLSMGGSWNYGGGQVNTGVPNSIHVDFTLDLVDGGANTGTVSFYEIGNPSNSGSFSLGSITGTLNYDKLQIWAYTAGTSVTGFDNLTITPEPATLVVMGAGGLLALLRKRRG